MNIFKRKKHIPVINVTFTEEQLNYMAEAISEHIFEMQKEFMDNMPPDRINIINDLVHLNVSLSNALNLEQYEIADLIKKEIEILKKKLSEIS